MAGPYAVSDVSFSGNNQTLPSCQNGMLQHQMMPLSNCMPVHLPGSPYYEQQTISLAVPVSGSNPTQEAGLNTAENDRETIGVITID